MARRPPDPVTPGGPERALDEALGRARRHAKNAVAEALEAARALLDAATLATSGASASEHPVFSRADAWIRDVSSSLVGSGGLPEDLGASLADALDREIARWEQRARQDDDARAVLRAFLGLREMLWEVGIRPSETPRRDPPPTTRPLRQEKHAGAPGGRRVERVPVQG